MGRVYANNPPTETPAPAPSKGRVYLKELGGEPSPQAAFARGVVNSPARTVQGLGAAAGYASPRSGQVIRQIGDALAARSEPLANRIAPPSNGGLPGIMEGIGEQTVPMLANGAMGAVTSGPLAAAGEVILSAATPAVGAGLRNLGATDKQAVAGEVLFNVAAPGTALRALYAGGYRGPVQPAMHELRARIGARGIVNVDPMGTGRNFESAADQLARSQRNVVDPRFSQTSEQVLRDTVPNLENLAIRKAQVDPKFNTVIGGRKALIGEGQAARVEHVVGTPEPVASVRNSFKTARDAEQTSASGLFKQLALGGESPANDMYIERAIQQAEQDAMQANSDTLPKKQIKQLRAFNGKIPWDELQAIRSRLGAIAEVGRSPGASDVARLRTRWAETIRDGIDQTIENTPSLETKYPEAIAAWRRYKTVFDRKSRAYKALETQDNPSRLVSEVLDGRDGIAEADRVREMYANDPQGLTDFKGLVASETFLTGKSPSQVARQYAARRAAMEKLWDPDEMRVFDEIASDGIDIASGKAGRRGMNYGAGSSTAPIPTQGGFMGWLAKTGANLFSGQDLAKNKAMERLIMNPRELEPVYRAWKFGAARDAGKLLLGAVMKSAARSTVNTAPDLAVSQPLEEPRR